MRSLFFQPLFFVLILSIQFVACSGTTTQDTQSNLVSLEDLEVPESSYCFEDVETARLVGQLYNLSGVLKSSYQELEWFLNEHEADFAQNSPLTSCMRDFGIFLKSKGHIAYSRYPHSKAYENAVLAGANSDQATKIANDLTRDASDMVLIGEELIWLSEVIPAAVEGDWSQFRQSGTDMRRQIKPMLALMQQMNDPYMNSALQDAVSEFEPYMTEYIASLALMSHLEVR